MRDVRQDAEDRDRIQNIDYKQYRNNRWLEIERNVQLVLLYIIFDIRFRIIFKTESNQTIGNKVKKDEGMDRECSVNVM